MKVAHFGNFAPSSCGMFHTTADTVLAEREVGIDSQFIDWGHAKDYKQQYSRVGLTHGSITTVAPQWAMDEADVLVLHSALPDFVKSTGKPIVIAIHGRPEYSFVLEKLKKGACLNLYHKFAKDPQVAAFFTYWKEHLDYWNMILKKPVQHVPSMVDLDKFCPQGKSTSFKNPGKPNILIADIWREDVSPFSVVFAAARFIKEKCPEGRIHLYGLSKPNETSALANILNPLKERKIVGDVRGLMTNIDEAYRIADILITPHNIATRVVREALASGCPIVAGKGSAYTSYQADPHDTVAFASEIEQCWQDLQELGLDMRQAARVVAKENFNLEQAGIVLKGIYEKVVAENIERQQIEAAKVAKKRDYRIYTFTPYTTPDEGKDVGKAYNACMKLLPNDNDWACFLDHDAMFTTLDWNHQLYEIIDANPDYSCLTAVTNRIGNPDQKFANIKSDNHDIVYHRKIGTDAQGQFRTDVKDLTTKQAISGVVILVQKKAWKEAGGFEEEGFLGIDNHFDIALRKEGMKTGLMKGIYVYHWYRFMNSELKPIM